MHNHIEKVLIDEAVIQKRLDVLAERVTEEFEGKSIVVVALLKGAILFMSDLLRRIPLTMEIECLNVSSYHGGTESSGEVSFLDRKLPDVSGKSVLLLDDILDTGRTLDAVIKKLSEHGASEVKTCVLLTKDIERDIVLKADFTGFVIGDEFVVGYGLDYQGKYRNLPYVGILKESAI
ncbi:MAG TPA: hypoxanthine phosphoribosyltransferase [Verrucomicrobiales bacterium]|nr:hypoxanthine phosphoribosyltransferase [Verrucomicrobiales bacterium]HCL98034.1 hypoxanthine phosphoribosyltransferase [Verrucomicrobiales bacterium]